MTAVWTRASVCGGLVVLLSACGGERRAVSTPIPRGPQILAITAREYRLQTGGVRTLRQGMTRITFSNRGKRGHALGVWRLRTGVTWAAFVRAARRDAAARLVSPRGGIRYLAPGARWEMTTRLRRGLYALIDYQEERGIENWRRGALRQLRVRGQKAPPFSVEGRPYTIRMRDFAFVLQRPEVSKDALIRVINEGKVVHEISLLRLARGTGISQGLQAVRAYLAGQSTRLPGQPYEFLGLVAPGWVGYVPAPPKPGRYLMFSFVTDSNGKTRAEMVNHLTVY